MLGKLTIVAVFAFSAGALGEHQSMLRPENTHRPQGEIRYQIKHSQENSEIEKILLGQIHPLKSNTDIIELVRGLPHEERDKLLALARQKLPLQTNDLLFEEVFQFVYAAILFYPELKSQSVSLLDSQAALLKRTLEDRTLSRAQVAETTALLKLIQEIKENKYRDPIQLESPQTFVDSNSVAWGSLPQNYEHPSGAIQLGRVEFDRPNGKGTATRIPISPGTSSGSDLLRISLHGSGDEAHYTLLNPSSDEIPVGYYSDLLKRGVSPKTLKALRKHLPRNINPTEIISESCNPDGNGCTPATYARWIQVEKVPNREQLKLKKVVMTPSGFSSGGIVDTPVSRLFGDQGSFAQPYYRDWMVRNFNSDLAPPHEYRLVRGGDPESENHWIDTGIYPDSRQMTFPLVGVFGEAKEYGRHLGLSPELGGGDSLSYLDKIRLINDNPDATYFQKVRSNLARPIGSAAALVRETWGLSRDLYHLLW